MRCNLFRNVINVRYFTFYKLQVFRLTPGTWWSSGVSLSSRARLLLPLSLLSQNLPFYFSWIFDTVSFITSKLGLYIWKRLKSCNSRLRKGGERETSPVVTLKIYVDYISSETGLYWILAIQILSIRDQHFLIWSAKWPAGLLLPSQ